MLCYPGGSLTEWMVKQVPQPKGPHVFMWVTTHNDNAAS